MIVHYSEKDTLRVLCEIHPTSRWDPVDRYPYVSPVKGDPTIIEVGTNNIVKGFTELYSIKPEADGSIKPKLIYASDREMTMIRSTNGVIEFRLLDKIDFHSIEHYSYWKLVPNTAMASDTNTLEAKLEEKAHPLVAKQLEPRFDASNSMWSDSHCFVSGIDYKFWKHFQHIDPDTEFEKKDQILFSSEGEQPGTMEIESWGLVYQPLTTDPSSSFRIVTEVKQLSRSVVKSETMSICRDQLKISDTQALVPYGSADRSDYYLFDTERGFSPLTPLPVLKGVQALSEAVKL